MIKRLGLMGKSNWQKQTEDHLKEVYPKLFQRMYYLQYKNGYRNEDEASDLVHDACIRCIEKADQWDGSSFLAFARKILENIYIDKFRRKMNYKDIISDMGYRMKSYFGNDTADEAFIRIKYEKCLKKLTKKQLNVFYVQISGRNEETKKPLTTNEMSKILGVPLGTLLPLLARAKKALGDCLYEHELKPTGAA